MSRWRNIFFFLSLSICGILSVGQGAAEAAALSDIQNHWAEKSIQKLSEQGIIEGYPDGSFKPDQPVNRAELAKMIAKTFTYAATSRSIPDAGNHWASTYISRVVDQGVMRLFTDGRFRPDTEVSRVQLAAFLTRIIHVALPEEKLPSRAASFSDLPAGHWGFRYVETIRGLDVLPENIITGKYQPDKPATRAEAAWMLNTLAGLEISKGKVTSIDPDTGLVNLQPAQGEPRLVMIAPETICLRNNLPSNIDAVLNGDEMTVVALSSGEVKYCKAFGQVTKNDLLSRLSTLTKGRLTNEQISALVSGDWNMLKNDLKGNLYNKLVDMGLTPSEAESIMVQDWNYLDVLSRDRLAKAISSYLGITEEFSQALLARDFTKIKEYGKIELATNLLSRVLGGSGTQAPASEPY